MNWTWMGFGKANSPINYDNRADENDELARRKRDCIRASTNWLYSRKINRYNELVSIFKEN